MSLRRAELARSAGALSHADWRWLLALGALQAVTIALTGLTYRSSLRQVGHRLSWGRCVDVYLERHVVGTITPIGGPASIFAFVRRLQSHNIGSGDALLALGVRSIAGYSAFVALLLPTIIVHRPSPAVLIGFVVLSALLLILLAGFYIAQRGNGLPVALARRLPPRVERFMLQLTDRRLPPRAFVWPFVFALATNLASALVLFVALFAMGASPSPTTAIAGYVIGNLFLMVAPVFQGIGVVELTMAVALQQLGIPLPAAVGATLLFRFGDVWLPLIAGVLVQLGRKVHLPAPSEGGRTVTALIPRPRAFLAAATVRGGALWLSRWSAISIALSIPSLLAFVTLLTHHY